jgi:hypothetical protein
MEVRRMPHNDDTMITEATPGHVASTGGLGFTAPTKDVLDVCCGSRMMWFDKADGRALFLDKRREVTTDPVRQPLAGARARAALAGG